MLLLDYPDLSGLVRSSDMGSCCSFEQVKMCYLVEVLQKLVAAQGSAAKSAIVFVGTCQK